MAQASSWWQQIVSQIPESSLTKFKSKTLKRLVGNRFRGSGGLLIIVAFVVAMLVWNWKLMLATGSGVFVMLLVYLMQEWNWQVHWSSLRRLLSGKNKQLTLAVGSGAIASFSTYMTIAIWVESDSPWIATGAILQGFGTLAILVLLIWQTVSRQINREESNINKLLNKLTEVEPLKRLIAVKQLTVLAADKEVDVAHKKAIADYLRLMLSQEQEPIIRDAVLEGLEALNEAQILNKVAIPVNLNNSKNQSAVKINAPTF